MNYAQEKTQAYRIMLAASTLFEHHPYETITLADVSIVTDVSIDEARTVFGTMHALGTEILTYEGNSMRAAQARANESACDPLEQLFLAFRFVGENLAEDSIVRAGVRIAGESHHCFPERNINPFRTWQRFITSKLEMIAPGGRYGDVNLDETAWLLTAAGLGTKDLLAFTKDWDSAPSLLERIARQALMNLNFQRPSRAEMERESDE